MLKELDRERLQVSGAMIERWIDDEFDKVDEDGSQSVSLPEFSAYVTSMTRWMRDERRRRRLIHGYTAANRPL